METVKSICSRDSTTKWGQKGKKIHFSLSAKTGFAVTSEVQNFADMSANNKFFLTPSLYYFSSFHRYLASHNKFPIINTIKT